MMCQFQSLFFADDGYIVRCKQCNFYQVAYISTMLTLSETDFRELRKLVKRKCNEADPFSAPQSKTVVLKTPAQGVYFMLTLPEANRFCEILEEANNEAKALKMISLFNP